MPTSPSSSTSGLSGAGRANGRPGDGEARREVRGRDRRRQGRRRRQPPDPAAFNIMSIPTIAFFAPGKQPMGVVGFRPLEQLESQFGLAEYPKVAAPGRRAGRRRRPPRRPPDRSQFFTSTAPAPPGAVSIPGPRRGPDQPPGTRAAMRRREPGLEAIAGMVVEDGRRERHPVRTSRGGRRVGRAGGRVGDRRPDAEIGARRRRARRRLVPSRLHVRRSPASDPTATSCELGGRRVELRRGARSSPSCPAAAARIASRSGAWSS